MNLFTVLAVVFIVLKLTHVIAWPWYLVLLPLYGSALIFFFIFFLAALSKRKL